jgi:hypothetical protein
MGARTLILRHDARGEALEPSVEAIDDGYGPFGANAHIDVSADELWIARV